MQNTSNETKHRYKLVNILRSILILECEFCFNFNLKLNNVTETTGQIISTQSYFSFGYGLNNT